MKNLSKVYTHPLSEKELIYEALKYATSFYEDQCVPAKGQLEELQEELYEDLFGFRDKQGDTPRNRPVKFTLIEIFKDLKFGRPGESQKLLNGFIDQLKENEDKDIIWP